MSYKVVGLLGRGGSAVVELALDGDGRPVATKRVGLTGSGEQIRVARRRLRRESEILRGLAHPGIVPVLDVVEDGSDLILVFPAMAENLEDRVARLGPLPPGEVARIGRVLIAALAAAHRQGVIHRDIKPANILFDGAGRPAIADFGVAVTSDATAGLTEAGAVVGSPMWMAPEQARGEPASPASDVFSLGAALNFAATGQVPYAHRAGALPGRRAARPRIRPVASHLPEALRTPLARMLDPRPERRPSAAALLGGFDGTSVAPASFTRRRRALAGAGRLLRGALTAAAGVAFGRDGGVPGPGPRRPTAILLRRLASITGAAIGLVLIGLIATDLATTGNAGGTGPRNAPSGSPSAAGRAAAACHPLPYLPCGAAAPAPHTDGSTCNPGWYNLDGVAADGCEARSDYVAGTPLTQQAAVHANLVPLSATDTFVTHVSGDSLSLCWGSLHVTLTAPYQTAEQLTVWKGNTKVAGALSVNGAPATATVPKPSCFGSGSEDLRVTVGAVAATGGASAKDFTLTRDAGW